MPVRSLPTRPDLGQLELQAEELYSDHGARRLPAAARIAANHPRMKGQSLQAILDRPLVLSDAQRVLAREYGFPSWAELFPQAAATAVRRLRVASWCGLSKIWLGGPDSMIWPSPKT